MTRRLLSEPPTHVIFDLDGTLLDTEALYTEATQAVVGRFGKTYGWEIKQHVIGGQAEVGAAFTIAQLELPMSVEAYLTERDAVLLPLFDHTEPMPGALALIDALAEAGVGLAIATSGDRSLTQRKLARHAFVARFSAVVCAGDPGVKAAKPAPDLFLAAARQLGAEPARCLVIEDAPNGAAAARAAGMPYLAVIDRRLWDRDWSGAIAVVESLEEVTLGALGLER